LQVFLYAPGEIRTPDLRFRRPSQREDVLLHLSADVPPDDEAVELLQREAPFVADTSAWWRLSSLPDDLAGALEAGRSGRTRGL
jgi:hypothetical protein